MGHYDDDYYEEPPRNVKLNRIRRLLNDAKREAGENFSKIDHGGLHDSPDKFYLAALLVEVCAISGTLERIERVLDSILDEVKSER